MTTTEREGCACDMCKVACQTKPGFLAPGDLQNIAEYLEVPDDDYVDFLRDHFDASEGALVANPATGTAFRIPSIVPSQLPGGCCVFLTEDNKCSIHPAAPFGCREFSVCDTTTPPEKTNEKLAGALRQMLESAEYRQTHRSLQQEGCVARPLLARATAMSRQLAALP